VILRELITDGIVLVYLDILIIPAKDEEENLKKLRKILAMEPRSKLEKV